MEQQPRDPKSKRWITILAVVATYAFLVALHGSTVVDCWKPKPDNCYYMELARSLAQGEGYGYQGVPHTTYPPGWPLLLAMPLGLGLDSSFALRIFSAAITLLACLGTHLLARQRLRPLVALVPVLLFGVSSHVVRLAPFLYSDVAYAMWSLFGLWGLHHVLHGERIRTGFTILAGVCSAMALLTRTVGATVGVSGSALLFWRWWKEPAGTSQRRRAGFALVLYSILWSVPTLIWMGRANLFSPPGERTNRGVWFLVDPYDFSKGYVSATELLDRVVAKTALESSHLGRLLSADFMTGKGASYLGLGLALVFVVPFLWRRMAGWNLLGVYSGLYFLTYALWPFNEATRFMVPLLPVMGILVFDGARRLGARWGTAIVMVAAAIVGAQSVRESLRVLPGVRTQPLPLLEGRWVESATLQVGLYLRHQTPAEAVFLAFPGTVEREISGRTLQVVDTTSSRDVVLSQAAEVDYVVVYKTNAWSQSHLLEALLANQDRFERCFQAGHGFVFRVRK